MNYTMTELMDRLWTVATFDDAEAAMGRAEDWYNSTSKREMLAWYEAARRTNTSMPEIVYDDGTLIDDWATVVMFYRAASLADLKS